jgi:hypothetical protein
MPVDRRSKSVGAGVPAGVPLTDAALGDGDAVGLALPLPSGDGDALALPLALPVVGGA